jgi:hypothetical protein
LIKKPKRYSLQTSRFYRCGKTVYPSAVYPHLRLFAAVRLVKTRPASNSESNISGNNFDGQVISSTQELFSAIN